MLYDDAMINRHYHFSLIICCCLVLAACARPARKFDVLDLYDLPQANPISARYPVAVDNDSYYSQPGGYKGCAEINDAPSCGGG